MAIENCHLWWFVPLKMVILQSYVWLPGIWLVASTPLKYISQLGWLFPICGKIENVPNQICKKMKPPNATNQYLCWGEFCWDPGAPTSTGIPNFVSKHRSNAARQFPESCSRMTSTRCELLTVLLVFLRQQGLCLGRKFWHHTKPIMWV